MADFKTDNPGDAASSESIQKIALVSRNYNVEEAGLWDYSRHAAIINRCCDAAGCDTVIYSLYTWDSRSPFRRTPEAMFKDLKNVQRIIIETGDMSLNGDNPYYLDLSVEAWVRGMKRPIPMQQRFSRTGQDRDQGGHKLIEDLKDRRLADGMVLICGESNVASLIKRHGSGFDDPFGFNAALDRMGVKIVLNPIHDYMVRWEMARKRAYYSQHQRTVVSVWNKGNGHGENVQPWTVYHNGEDLSDLVYALPSPIKQREDIRIGVVEMSKVMERAAQLAQSASAAG